MLEKRAKYIGIKASRKKHVNDEEQFGHCDNR